MGALARLGSADRDHLIAATGLSKGIVGDALGDLLERNMVRPLGKSTNPRSAVVEINPGAAHVVGVSVDDHEARATVADLLGTPLAEKSIPLGAHRAADIAELCQLLGESAGISSIECLVLGGAVGSHESSARTTASGSQVVSIDLAVELNDRLGASVHLEDEALLAVLGERWHGAARGFDDVALLWVGRRVGLGQLFNGRPVRGANGRAGDIGHLPLGPEPVGRGHRRGSFELVATSSGMRLAMATALEHGGETTLTLASTARQILDAADWGDRLARRLVDVEADLLAKAVLSVVCTTDPAMIILGGEIGSHDAMLAPVQDACSRVLSYPARIERSQLGEHAVMVGAVAVAVERARHTLLGAPPHTP